MKTEVQSNKTIAGTEKSYAVQRSCGIHMVDAVWDKPFWRDVEPLAVNLPHWPVQSDFLPATEMKLKYDDDCFYAIARVHDRFVRAVAVQTHDAVWKDSCVEFFFSPDPGHSNRYFNLEINCCGVLLAEYHTGPRLNGRKLDIDDCRAIRVSSSASGPIRREIAKPLTWTLEYALPFDVLEKYAAIEKPAPGVNWRANFYKCADGSSHPHWMTWSPIALAEPDFHRPEYFGRIEFT